ncbi:hypothetical protein [Cryptosporangium sp. NPDC048952]|uniref:hypothetical protein n=1 Tax=Cryptosporangium sp. NPDC048952 TaxID=3363961 RepID=UPI0037228D98
MPSLISVLGPVEVELLVAFHAHYRALGVTDFRLAFHFTDHADPGTIDELLTACRDLIGPPAIISRGPWHETLHSQLRDQLRAAATAEHGPGWHLLADSDEFQVHPLTMPEQIAAAETDQRLVVGGLLLDRVTADGQLTGWNPADGLDATYPLGGFLTHRLLRADPRKIVLAHSSAPLALGSHRSPGHRYRNSPLVAVHHFKWRSPVIADLQGRVRHHASGAWKEETPAIRTEAARLLAHLDTHDGRIDTTDPALDWRPVSLTEIPPWWPDLAAQITTQFRPPTPSPATQP